MGRCYGGCRCCGICGGFLGFTLGFYLIHLLLCALRWLYLERLRPLIHCLAQPVEGYLRAVLRLWQWYAEGDVVVLNALEVLAVGAEFLDTLKRETYLAERLLAGGYLDARHRQRVAVFSLHPYGIGV